MKTTRNLKSIMSLVLSVALIMTCIPLSTITAGATPGVVGTVVDPGTADVWEQMLGNDADGNRYAGRVWVDKSVYKNGDTVVLNNKGEQGSTFDVALQDDATFQVVFSALGSTMTTKSIVSSSGPLDVVLILDDSTSMDDRISGNTTRLEKLIAASNGLLEDLSTTQDIRIGIVAYNNDAIQVLPFGRYNNGIVLSILSNKYDFDENNARDKGGTIQAKDKNGSLLYNNTNGYARGTNIQSGFDMGMRMLENADNTEGRAPVAILLTDGAANTAVRERFYNIDGQNPVQVFKRDDQSDHKIAPGVALATILNAAFRKASVEDHYGKAPAVYGVGVDLGGNSAAYALINPGSRINGFNSNNASSDIRTAYNNYINAWLKGNTVETTDRNEYNNQSYKFKIDHGYKTTTNISTQDIVDNVNYVDTYYDVSSTELENTFKQIFEELSSGAFNPISSSTTVEGNIGVDNTPLIYVDFIGQYMEIKEIQAVSLFGSSYAVVKNEDGTYTVDAGAGTNPTTNESWNTSEDIIISVTETDGIQKLEIRINQEILPIILEQAVSETVGGVTNATITEVMQSPLRVYYTVGMDSDILLPNGKVDISKIRGYQNIDNNAGTVSFYSNQYGVMNAADVNGEVINGDAHVGFKPSAENRYYYYQYNQGIFTSVTNKLDGSAVTVPENSEYGILWDETKYDLNWMSYEEYLTTEDTKDVYTYVTYYRPTLSAADAVNAAEEVTYLICTDWRYLKESVAFYDSTAEKYINDGVALPLDQVANVIAAYKQNNANAEIRAVLGKGSVRTSRFHNMTFDKAENLTGTAIKRYTPEYTHDTAKEHNGNDVVVWLGNNGKVTVPIDTGIALTKNITESIGNTDDTYALTVTVLGSVSKNPVVTDETGNDVTASISTYSNNVLTVKVKAEETVYISGIPGGTVCEIGEIVDGDYYKVDAQSTAFVTIPTVSQVLDAANPVAQFVQATVTNAPNKYGNLTIIKDISHDFTDVPAQMAEKVFTFKVQLPAALAGKTYTVDAVNASLFAGTEITLEEDGSFTVNLKDNESITILDLPEGTAYKVTEVSSVVGYTNITGIVNGTIAPDGDHDAHFINEYGYTSIKPEVIISGTKILQDKYGTYNINEDYIFVLSRYNTIKDEYHELARATAKDGGRYEFKLDALLTESLGIGDHYFRVMEENGTTPGMSYDSTRGLFVVRITDNDADGSLEYVVENVANTAVNGNTVTKDFTNIYDVETTYVDIDIEKKLNNNTGVDIPLNEFSFKLVNKQNANINYTVTTDASGMATIRISELREGIYEYELTEIAGNRPGMSYDPATIPVYVKVINDDGVLRAFVQTTPFNTEVSSVDVSNTDVSGGDVSSGDVAIGDVSGGDVAVGDAGGSTAGIPGIEPIVFVNEYDLGFTEYTISGTKKLEGRDIEGSEFQFELYETDEAFELADNVTAKQVVGNNEANGAEAEFSFSQITYTKVGTYYYVVKEKAGSAVGVTYDTTHYHVTVTVDVDGDGLKVTDVNVNKIGHNSNTTGNIVFVNTYETKSTEYALGGSKVLHGRAPRDGEFFFELYEGDNLIETVANKADGRFSFKALSYTKAGTYTYTIKEVDGTSPGVTYNGVNAPVTVTVTVTDDVTNAALSAFANVSNADIKFENTYVAAAAQIAFKGTKTLKGDTLVDNSFTFKLYQTDNSFDITKSNTELLASTKNVNGEFSYARKLSTTGTYFFVIVEDAAVDTIEDVVYDGTQYKFIVQVSDVGDGLLKASVTNINTGVTTAAAAIVTINNVGFTNATYDEVTEKEVYLEGDTTIQIDGQKVKPGDILTYFITYTNYTGEDVVVDIMDTIPEYTTYVDGSASHNGTYAGTHVNWILNVAKGESVTVSFNVKVDATNVIVPNEAVVRDSVNSYITNEVVNHTVENELVKDVFSAEDDTVSIDGEKVYEGDELLYKISFTNTTGNEVDIKIIDVIPANTTYVAGSADNGGVYGNGTVVWDIQDVPAWETVTVTFKVTVNDNVGAVTIKNQATATDGTNNYETEWVTNYTVKDEVEKKVFASDNKQINIDGKQVYEGDELVYTITYKNTAEEIATVTITDTIPHYTTYVGGSADNGGVYDNGVITWTKDVAANESITVSFKVKVNEGIGTKIISNEATIAEGKNSYTTNKVFNYTFKELEESNPESPDEPTDTYVVPAAPATGDDSNLWMWFALLFICSGGLVGTVFYGKKRKATEK